MEQTTFTERAGVAYATVGRGKRIHYSPRTDDTLCGRALTTYRDAEEVVALLDTGHELCTPCHRAAEQRAEARRLAAESPLAAAAVELADTVEATDAERAEQANVIRVSIRAHRAPGGGRMRLLAYVHTNCGCSLASTLVGAFDNLAEAEALAAGATPERFRHCTKSTPIREQAPAVEAEAPAAEHQEQPARDEPSDTWTITNRAGVEIARVEGATAEDMTRAAEALPKVRAMIRREGGFTRRRLWVSELTPADVEQAPTAAGAEQQPVAEVERRVVEGVVVEHAGTTEGSWPRHATHPDVIAARAALDGLAVATVTEHHDVTDPTEDEQSVRGYLVDPRKHGRVAVYWLEQGRIVRREDPWRGPSLDCLADRLGRRGWVVEKLTRSSQCVFAHVPAEGATPAPQETAAAVESAPAGPVPGALVDPWTWIRRPASSYDTRRTAPTAVEPTAPACLHHIAVRPEVSGDPITTCARKQPTQEAGVFSDEGCVEAYDCAVQAANRAAELNAEDDSDDPLYGWDLMCPDHREQHVDTCEECTAEEPEGEVEETPEAGGTWRSGWMAAEQQVMEEALFDLGDGVEQGLLFQ
ncbi:hypothetical protein [Streptomyces sp. C36]|uniref:hypothetical protein n=1 Tax=Streptomyces sp. C36 TaxID=3237122 RepID=UPI0034C6354E